MTESTSTPSCCQRNLWHERFLAMQPTIRQHVVWHLRKSKPSEREDLNCEAVGFAFVMFLRLAQQGRIELAYPSTLADFACRQVRAGRRIGSSLNVHDVMSRHCRRSKGVTVESLDGAQAFSEQWREVIVADRKSTPAEIAALRIDFSEWLAELPRHLRQAAELLATGEKTSNAALQLGISSARVSQLRRELWTAWHRFQGEPTVSAAP